MDISFYIHVINTHKSCEMNVKIAAINLPIVSPICCAFFYPYTTIHYHTLPYYAVLDIVGIFKFNMTLNILIIKNFFLEVKCLYITLYLYETILHCVI